jgi:hypothetical protein
VMTISAVFGPDLLMVVLAMLIGLEITMWAVIDIASHSQAAFAGAGSSKVAWIIVIVGFTFFMGFGSLLAIYYLVGVRGKVRAAEKLLQNS